MKGISWEEGEKILLKNRRFAEERKRTEPEFQALMKLILLKKEGRINKDRFKKIIQKCRFIVTIDKGY